MDEERDRIKRERPDKPGLVQDFDATVKAITRREVQIDADLKEGRITQQQADEKQAALRDRRSNSLADEVRVQVHAERAGRRDPQASSPAREKHVAEVRTEVEAKGTEVGLDEAANLLASATNKPAAATEPPQKTADAGEKPKPGQGERANADPGQAQSEVDPFWWTVSRLTI